MSACPRCGTALDEGAACTCDAAVGAPPTSLPVTARAVAPPPQVATPAPAWVYVPPPPINIVIQNQYVVPTVGAPTDGVLETAPYVRKKDPGLSTLLSFLAPGGGQIYNGESSKGLIFLFLTFFVNVPLMFVGVGFFTGLAVWIWAMVDAHSVAEKINRGQRVV